MRNGIVHRIVLLGGVLALGLVLALPGAATAELHEATIQLDEAQATTCAVGSTTQGIGTVTFDDVTNLMSWSYTYGDNDPNFDDGDLFGAGTETVSHFHGPAAPGFTAGVKEGTGTGNPNVGSATIGLAQDRADLLDDLWYLNVHSTSCTGGEIRGQVLFPAAVPSLSPASLALLVIALIAVALLLARRMRPAHPPPVPR